MERNIKITVADKVATAEKGASVICGNKDYTATFIFDDEWEGIEVKTARFVVNGKHTDVVFTGDTVAIPPVSNSVALQIGVFAGDMTTKPAFVTCEKSILCESGSVADPAPDVYNQIIDQINAGMIKGEPGEQGAKGDKGDPGPQGPAGADGVLIDDNRSSESSVWSSRKTSLHVATTISATGASVELDMPDDVPVNVVCQLTEVQSGEGTPSPENIREFIPYRVVNVTQTNETDTKVYTTEFDRDVYGGFLLCSNKELIITRALRIFTGEEKWTLHTSSSTHIAFKCTIGEKVSERESPCSHFPYYQFSGSNLTAEGYAVGSDLSTRYIVLSLERGISDAAAFKTWVAEQYANGTPVSVLDYTATREGTQVDAPEIRSLGGKCTFTCDRGDVVVIGLINPNAAFKRIEQRLAALEAAITGI